jgi:hypothetical protein
MTIADFATVIGTLAVATGKELDNETVDVYFAALKDVPLETLQAATGRLVNSSRFFPSVGEIRASCDRVRAGKAFTTFIPPALPSGALRDDDPRLWYACTTCQDSGWASHWCPGSVNAQPKDHEVFQSIRPCGSHACARFGKQGYGHEFMVRCGCYHANRVIQERLASRKTYAETPA